MVQAALVVLVLMELYHLVLVLDLVVVGLEIYKVQNLVLYRLVVELVLVEGTHLEAVKLVVLGIHHLLL
jgi:hypothetical protein